MIRFDHIAIGGTFDRLHKGHKAFIQYAFKIAEKVTIAVTSKSFINSKSLSSIILPYEMREDEIKSFINQLRTTKNTKIIALDNIYGVAVEDKTLDAILVTSETKKNAEKINRLRVKRKMKRLEIVTFPFIKGPDKKIIRSSRIRIGEINRSGLSFQSLIKKNKVYGLPSELRHSLHKPIGQLVHGTVFEKTAKKAKEIIQTRKPAVLITVGDVVSMSFIKAGLNPDVLIVDLRTQRHAYEYFSNKFSGNAFINKAGTVNGNTALIIKSYLRQISSDKANNKIFIEGEEDLLVLPSILLSPLNSVVAYGQSNCGIVLVDVTESIKEMALSILKKFKSSKP